MKTIKTLTISSLFIAFFCGCGTVKYHKEITKTDGTKEIVDFKGNSGWSRSTFNGLTIDGVTKTTTNGLKMTGVATQPDAESITATGGAAGTLIGNAVKAYTSGGLP